MSWITKKAYTFCKNGIFLQKGRIDRSEQKNLAAPMRARIPYLVYSFALEKHFSERWIYNSLRLD